VGGCPKCPQLGDGHFGHSRFKIFANFEIDGHFGGGGLGVEKCWGTPIRCLERELSTLRISVNLNIPSEEKELFL
jgi:hypothetical protein